MTAIPTPTLTPRDVIRAAAAIVAVRGGYRSVRCTGETGEPTAREVANYLSGAELAAPEDREHFDAAVAEAADTAAAVCAWCIAGASEGTKYRTRLARLVKSGRMRERDLALVASAVGAWLSDRQREEIETELALDARRSRHRGQIGERLTFIAEVVAVIRLADRYYGNAVQHPHLVKLRDTSGNVYLWQATTERIPDRHATVEIAGTVKAHTEYRGIAQTKLSYCLWSLTDLSFS